MHAMKKIWLLLILTPLLSASAQTVQVDLAPWLFGAKVGFNFNNVDSTDAFENSWEGDESLSFGLKSIYKMTENHGLNMEFLYDRKQMEAKNIAGGSMEAQFTYLALGVNYQYTLTQFPMLILLGANVGFNVDSELEVSNTSTTVNADITNENSPVFNLVGGLGYQYAFSNGIVLQPEATYIYGLSDINDVGTKFKIHSAQIALSVLY